MKKESQAERIVVLAGASSAGAPGHIFGEPLANHLVLSRSRFYRLTQGDEGIERSRYRDELRNPRPKALQDSMLVRDLAILWGKYGFRGLSAVASAMEEYCHRGPSVFITTESILRSNDAVPRAEGNDALHVLQMDDLTRWRCFTRDVATLWVKHRRCSLIDLTKEIERYCWVRERALKRSPGRSKSWDDNGNVAAFLCIAGTWHRKDKHSDLSSFLRTVKLPWVIMSDEKNGRKLEFENLRTLRNRFYLGRKIARKNPYLKRHFAHLFALPAQKRRQKQR